MPDRLAQLLGVAALAASDRLRAAVEAETEHGGSAPAALVHLQAWPGDTVEALRRVLRIAQPATVRLVNRLEAEGMVERRPGRDRRTVALHLTPKGDRVATRLLARRGEALTGLLDVLRPEDRERLEPLLERLVAGLADDRPDALTVCRLCDRGSCIAESGCPLDHTVEA